MKIRYIRYLMSVNCAILLLFAAFFNLDLNAQSCIDGSYNFIDDIQPIIIAKCSPCHTGGGSTGGWNADNYANTLAAGNNCGPGVVPGNSAMSSLLTKSAFFAGAGPSTSCNSDMPTMGTPLSFAEYQSIENWILQGAQESCPPIIGGCLDPTACNYDNTANQDLNNCEYPGDLCDDSDVNTENDALDALCICVGTPIIVNGCTDNTACNYDENANTDDNSCLFPNDPCDDGLPNTDNDTFGADCICAGVPTGNIEGCTDDTACNYNSAATIDDGSCTVDDCLGVCGGTAVVNSACDDADANTVLDVYDANCICAGIAGILGCMDNTACNYDATANIDNGDCLYLDCNLVCGGIDTIGAVCDDLDASTTNDVFDAGCNCIGVLAVSGCTDPTACNYLVFATVDDGSCAFGNLFCDDPCNDVIGCTNIIAQNFNPNATCDDGTCTILGCTDPNACNFNPLANTDDATCVADISITPDVYADPVNLTAEITLTINGGIPSIIGSNIQYNVTGDYDGTATAGNSFISDATFPCGSTYEVYVEDTVCSNALLFVVDCFIEGCTDINACNYVPAATIEDSSCLYLDCENNCGGIDTIGASCDDGSSFTVNDIYNSDCLCIGVTVTGCTDIASCNYNPAATIDDESCLYNDCFGVCGGPNVIGSSCNDGDPNTSFDMYDANCNCAGVLIPILGCIDPSACNFDPTANLDDGSCILVDGGTIFTLDATTFCTNDFVSDEVTVIVQDSTGTDYGFIVTSEDTSIVIAGPTNDPVIDFNGAPAGSTFIIWGVAFDLFDVPDDTVANITGCFDLSNGILINADDCIINGCTDPAACNFNPLANVDDGTCAEFDCDGNCGGPGIAGTPCDDGDPNTIIDVWDEYCNCVEAAIFGCTDYYACNFNGQATVDDGSCAEEDCDGNCDGPNMPGTPCDDGDPNTTGDIVTGNCLCVGIPTSCLSEEGTLAFTTGGIYGNGGAICYEQTVVVDADDFILLPGQSVYYIYHTVGPNIGYGNIPIAPVDVVEMGSFLTNTYGKNTIWVTAIAATSDGNGGPDYTDECLTISNTLIVELLGPITITTTEECDTEDGEFLYSFIVGGGLPECLPYATYTINGAYFYGIAGYLEEIYVGPISDGATYDITAMDGNGCIGYFERSVDCQKLPIELEEFDGNVKNEGNLIYWTTLTEFNNDYFVLESSKDGVNFEEIASIEAEGFSSSRRNYEFLDKNAGSGKTYYQLSHADNNGFFETVRHKILRRDAVAFNIESVNPIPTSDILNVELNIGANSNVDLEIIDILGHSIYNSKHNTTTGLNTITLNVSDFANGIYFVSIKVDNNVSLHKFIVE